MNKSILGMNRTTGERELESGEPLPIRRQLEIALDVAAEYAIYRPEKGRAKMTEIAEQLRIVDAINPEAQALYFELNDDPSQDWGEPSEDYKNSQPYHNDLYPFV